MACPCCAPFAVICTDCCPELLDPNVPGQKSIGLDVALSFSASCSGQNYSASVNETITALNGSGCPFGPLCSACIFYANFQPQDTAICEFQVTTTITVQNGLCFAQMAIQPSISGDLWGMCNKSGFICPARPGFSRHGFFFGKQTTNQQFYSATGCMNGLVFPFDGTVTSFLGNIVSVQGSITVVDNPLP